MKTATCLHATYRANNRILVQCDCWCSSCYDGFQCVCSECDHDVKIPLHPAYYGEKPEQVDHSCVDCGTEVFRKGTRGRWPSRCPDCKEKL